MINQDELRRLVEADLNKIGQSLLPRLTDEDRLNKRIEIENRYRRDKTPMKHKSDAEIMDAFYSGGRKD